MTQEVHLEDNNGGPEHACVLHESPAPVPLNMWKLAQVNSLHNL